jgi:hypothetical protein
MSDHKPERQSEAFSKNSTILEHVEELTTETTIAPSPSNPEAGLKLIPWQEIWNSLKVARVRGNGEMIEVFYDTLFKEAVFDDRGAWALDLKARR